MRLAIYITYVDGKLTKELHGSNNLDIHTYIQSINIVQDFMLAEIYINKKLIIITTTVTIIIITIGISITTSRAES